MRIDFHSHILPGIDDGSKSVEQSITMLKMAAEQGIDHVVATPHFYARHDTPERFLARRADAEQRLREEMARHTRLPQISMGAEVYFFRGISDCDKLSNLTFGQKNYILIEMAASPWTEAMLAEVGQIYYKQGITPVIAHVDRYIRPLRSFGIPEKLSQLPVLVQANAEFFLRPYTTAMALRMLRRQQIHLLGSDCHDLLHRPPNLGMAYDKIKKCLGPEWVECVDKCGENVLNGEFLAE